MVNFENGVTPINDTNLNKMQTALLGEVCSDSSQSNIVKKIVKHDNGEYEEYGTISNINVQVTEGKIIQVNLKNELKDTNYIVVATLSNPVAYWASSAVSVGIKNTNSFNLHLYNNANNDISNISVDYLIKGRWK